MSHLFQLTLSIAHLQRVLITQASGDHTLHPIQLGLLVGNALSVERISLEVLILTLARSTAENISPAAVGQGVANNGTPLVLGDRHGSRAGKRVGNGILVVDTGANLEPLLDSSSERHADADAVGNTLTGGNGNSCGSSVGVSDGGHGDIPAKEFLVGERDDELGITALLKTGEAVGLEGAREVIGRGLELDTIQVRLKVLSLNSLGSAITEDEDGLVSGDLIGGKSRSESTVGTEGGQQDEGHLHDVEMSN